MPVITDTSFAKKPGSTSYQYDPMYGTAKEFLNLSNSILEEARLDIFQDTNKVFRRDITDETIKNYFIENSADKEGMSADEYTDHICMMEQIYENYKEAVLEHSSMASVILGEKSVIM